MRNRTLLIAILSTAALFGCKKKSDEVVVDRAAPAGSANPATATAISNAEEYKTRGMAMNAKLMDVFKETDCDKLASALDHLLEANKADIAATSSWEKAHPGDRKDFEDANMKNMEAVTTAGMEHCKDNPAFKKAVDKLAAAE